ncbi:MAG: caspase family protein [bacterium]|nr:caspase family protein [bacterium]
MLTFKNIFFAGLLSCIALASVAQSPKKYFSAAQKLEKGNNYEGAIENYSKAIEMKADFEDAFVARAACYEKVNKKQEAIADYKKAITLLPKEKELYYNAGRLLASIGRYKDADEMLQLAIENDKKYSEAIAEEIGVLIKLKDYTTGVKMTQLAIDAKKSTSTLFAHAAMLDSLRNYPEAEKFYKSAKASDAKFIPAYVGLALTQIKLNKADEAMKVCEEALLKDPNNMDIYFTRSLVDAAKKDYQSAINDITKVILSRPNAAAYKQRAAFYIIMGQHQNAINDYTQVLLIDDTDLGAYLSRAAALEHTMNYKAAVADYNKVSALSTGNDNVSLVVKQAKKKIFELSRESEKPEVVLTSIKSVDNTIRVSADKNELIIKGQVKDASPIKNISVNSGIAKFSPDTLNPYFTLTLRDVTRLNDLSLTVTDVYGNTQVTRYKVEKTESDKPIIAIETPIATFENEIFIDNTNPEIYIQGTIKDASHIESIVIEGVTAVFNPSDLNPQFSSQLKIADKTKITMVVRDIYGNENKQVYALNRSGATAGLDNPMGNTWVVFIENSKYQSFPSLEGPAKDVMAMKAALANYKITKIVHKRDMTKNEMEKFFSIELRDYVRNNNINSLLIWYAGHGKYVSPTGYWVPSDGKTDDEFSYFGINNLKASMQAYAGKLVHTLVVTDACESGATFLMAMRGGDDEKHCDNFELTKAKSSQVFTSAGYELAADNSQFTKTFSSMLTNNTEACLPIEKIAKKVIIAVSNAGNQAPKFGKIKDLEDEGGTYFFIRK